MLNNTKRIKEIYKEIQKRIFYAIPGKWDELYLYASIIDRFGNMPKELENLIDIARIKYISKKLDIEKIASRKNAVVFTFKASSSEDKFKIDIAQLVKKYGTKIKFSAGIKPMITLDIGTSSERKVLNDTTKFVKYLLG